MIVQNSRLWQYLSPEQQSLGRDGALLVEDRKNNPNEHISDYSYLVFSFSKLYEGFLKQLFRDLGIISDTDYRSDHFRIGKSPSPNMVRRLGKRSAYGQLADRFGKELATRLWHTWKEGRNLVFHYFPHNYRALTPAQAEQLIALITSAMEEAVEQTKVMPRQHS